MNLEVQVSAVKVQISHHLMKLLNMLILIIILLGRKVPFLLMQGAIRGMGHGYITMET